MTKVCICQICNCGRHRCPHNEAKVLHKGDRPCQLSEYRNKFNPYEINLRKSCKPDYKPMVNDQPIEDKTTNRQDYVTHQLEKPFVRGGENYVAPEVAVDCMTSYKKDYNAKPIKVSKPIRKDLERKVPAKFEGLPTYKNDYRKWAVPQTQRVMQENAYIPPDAEFQGVTNYKVDYPGHKGGVVRQSMKPAERMNSPGAFADSTGYRSEYVKHPMPDKPVKEVAQYIPNKVALDDVSNYKKDYVAKQGGKPASFKPNDCGYRSDAAFSDATTQRLDFQAWKTSGRPQMRANDVYVEPSGDHDWHTTHQTTFTRKPLDARGEARKPAVNRAPAGQFEGCTNYADDYRKWPAQGVQQPTRKDRYTPTQSEPFRGTTNYTDDYRRGAAVPVRPSMKPDDRRTNSAGTFDGRTGYRDEYVKHAVKPATPKPAVEYKANPAKLDATTNYKNDFVAKSSGKTASCKPEGGGYRSDAPFQSDTTQRGDYVKWPGEKPYVRDCQVYCKPTGDMQFSTTASSAFNRKPLAKVNAARPAPRTSQPVKFAGNTNYADDFKRWPLVASHTSGQITGPPVYVPPEAPFVGNTSYAENFRGHRGVPHAKCMKPDNCAQTGDGVPFQGGTEYRQEFIRKQVEPCPAALLQADSTAFTFAEHSAAGHKLYRPKSSQRCNPRDSTAAAAGPVKLQPTIVAA